MNHCIIFLNQNFCIDVRRQSGNSKLRFLTSFLAEVEGSVSCHRNFLASDFKLIVNHLILNFIKPATIKRYQIGTYAFFQVNNLSNIVIDSLRMCALL